MCAGLYSGQFLLVWLRHQCCCGRLKPRLARELNVQRIVRRVSGAEVRLFSNLIMIMRMSPDALLGDPAQQHNVFTDYWPLTNTKSFRAENRTLQPV